MKEHYEQFFQEQMQHPEFAQTFFAARAERLQTDDVDVEVESLRRNREFMAFLAELSQEPANMTLEELRQELRH